MKKFLYWLIGKPWIQYAGNDKYICKVREGILTVALDKDLHGWCGDFYKNVYCKYDLTTARGIKEEYLKTKQWIK